MKSSKILVKRSNSPLQAPKTIQASQRKKKPTSNTQLASTYAKKSLKQFDTSNKTQKKRNSYLKQLLRTNGDSTNKYRIVTEPVQQRLLYLGNSNFGGGNNGSGMKIAGNSRSKLQSQQNQYTQKFLKLNIRTSQNSKEKLKTGESFHGREGCRNCQRYKQQLQHLKKQINKICMDKVLWKNGQMHIDDVKESYFKLRQMKGSNSNQWKSPINLNQEKSLFTRAIDKQLAQIRKHMYDLMRDVDSLSAIDYPKMLSLNIFKYDPFYTDSPSSQQQEMKQLLGQLRNSMQGKINVEELGDIGENNQHNKMIFRNLKNRLGYYMRENLELRIRKEVLQKSEEITQQSEDYLKKVIQEVLVGYVGDMDGGYQEE